jgi:hypothetical protein
VVQLRGTLDDAANLCLVFEPCRGGDLYKRLASCGLLSEAQLCKEVRAQRCCCVQGCLVHVACCLQGSHRRVSCAGWCGVAALLGHKRGWQQGLRTWLPQLLTRGSQQASWDALLASHAAMFLQALT